MTAPNIQTLCANTIRGLAMDAVQKANSGHPGAPMGMADIATVLWGEVLKYDPADPTWPDRDRVVLSAGHASMLLYSVLHLTGIALDLDDLKQFRQWGSETPGHPERAEPPGVETTTGPLGQGFANAVGMAMAERALRERLGQDLVDHHTYVLAGDGCLMEGVSYEAASLAGHLRLGRLIVLFDDNRITIDGSTDITTSEDIPGRFRAMGWGVEEADGHDMASVRAAIAAARADSDRPTLIRCRTTIARGAPKLAGSNHSHGAPLGHAEVAGAKAALGMDPALTFHVPDEVRAWFRRNDGDRARIHAEWRGRLAGHKHRDLFARLHAAPDTAAVSWPDFKAGTEVATRKASEKVLQAVAAAVPSLLGGSADLAGSNGSTIAGSGHLNGADFSGRNVHFGIREHAMGSICNGLALHGGVQPYCATFLVFHDYMRPAVRLAALMRLPVIYVYTHDSVFLGEDGPTHQPVEHLAAMRVIPNLRVVRPADANETTAAWRFALERRDGPTALCLSRQNLTIHPGTATPDAVSRGGYVLEGDGEVDVVLVATGSEVGLALQGRQALAARGVQARVVSMPCVERFLEQDADYRQGVLPSDVPRVSVEAGVTMGWGRITGDSGAQIGIDRFGASAPGEVVAEKLGLNVDNLVATVRRVLDRV